jgi:Cu/Ag efflux pump CusA
METMRIPEKTSGETHWRVIGDAAAEVGPALFFSLLIIVLSFIPVFTLEAQEDACFLRWPLQRLMPWRQQLALP